MNICSIDEINELQEIALPAENVFMNGKTIMNIDRCYEKCIHEGAVKKVLMTLPGKMVLQKTADIFRALSDPTRLRIVTALRDRELCVCDLSVVCGISESAVSHQLRVLRNLNIVRNRREGKIMFYSLDDAHVETLIGNCLEHVQAEHGR